MLFLKGFSRRENDESDEVDDEVRNTGTSQIHVTAALSMEEVFLRTQYL
jgi:hypothetical protein